MNYVRIKKDYSVGSLSEQSQSNLSQPQSLLLEKKIHMHLFLYSLPDLIKSENGNITMNTLLGIYKYAGKSASHV